MISCHAVVSIEYVEGGYTVVSRCIEYKGTEYYIRQLIDDSGERWEPFGNESRPYLSKRRHPKRDLITLARLAHIVGEFPLPYAANMIPIKIALRGKACIAVYLSVVVNKSTEDIAQTLDVNKQTVHQYLSDFRNDRR